MPAVDEQMQIARHKLRVIHFPVHSHGSDGASPHVARIFIWRDTLRRVREHKKENEPVGTFQPASRFFIFLFMLTGSRSSPLHVVYLRFLGRSSATPLNMQKSRVSRVGT
jgi:hypothetical protein